VGTVAPVEHLLPDAEHDRVHPKVETVEELLAQEGLHQVQLRRNAHARRTYPALRESTAAARMRLQRLSPRERVVLARAAAGETNAAIGAALFVGPGTVRKHLEHIYDKLEVHNRAGATAIYTQDRVVTEHIPDAP